MQKSGPPFGIHLKRKTLFFCHIAQVKDLGRKREEQARTKRIWTTDDSFMLLIFENKERVISLLFWPALVFFFASS